MTQSACWPAGQNLVRILRPLTQLWALPLSLSQGLAYVEYESESQASQAVLKMDGMTVKDNVIKVAISNPPQRKAPEKPEGRKGPTGPMVPRQMYGA